jgi:hypothetical protein
VLGAVLLLTRPSSGGERDEASIEPLIGPGSLGVRGRM